MFNFSPSLSSKKSAKTYFTNGSLPGYVDFKQPPTKKQPFKAINGVSFARSVELVLPEELYQTIWQKVEENVKSSKYIKVIMKLQDLLEGEIFTQYIKLGDVVMLSEGRPGLDNTFSVKHGLLRLDLDRTSYERCGLHGYPIEGSGKKHAKSRYCVEINLRLPSMLHGKKGFERIVWAAKNVLNRSLCWLVVNSQSIESTTSDTKDHDALLLQKHHGRQIVAGPHSNVQRKVRVPNLQIPNSSPGVGTHEQHELLETWVYELSEWLGLVGIASPRIKENDEIDPYLSRYTLPDGSSSSGETLRMLTWHGLLTARWITILFVELMKHSRSALPSHSNWLALTIYSHHTTETTQRDGYSIILPPPPASALASSSSKSGSGSTSPPPLTPAPNPEPDPVSDPATQDSQTTDTNTSHVSEDIADTVAGKITPVQSYICLEFDGSVT